MISKKRRRILDALQNYRCPECSGKAEFIELEVRVAVCTYNAKQKRWCLDGGGPLEEYDLTPEDVLDDVYQVCCRNCEKPITWPDGTVVNVSNEPGFEDWLEALANQWEKQKKEYTQLAAELEVAKQGMHPVGFIADLEGRVKALEAVTKLKPKQKTSDR